MSRRALFAAAAVFLAGVSGAFAHEDHDHDPRKMRFPATQTGGVILPVDLHTHSVFSDGSVWPDIRVQEAQRDGLTAFAVTEHLEYQPHSADIPHRDRNRSYQIAREEAGDALMVFNGSEITRDMPPGHVNAVFVTDANALRVRDAEAAIRVANAQGAFVFWNHPYWTAQRPDGIARLTEMHERLIAAGQLHGIEVANGADYSEAALQIALDNNLAILGTSDIHGLIDWDHDVPNGGHRTVSLVLASASTPEAIKQALVARRTVAWYRDQLIGRPAHVEEVVRAALSMRIEGLVEDSQLVKVIIENSSSVRFTLRVQPPTTLYNSGELIIIEPMDEIEIHVSGGVDAGALRLPVEVVNTVIAPDQTLSLTLSPR